MQHIVQSVASDIIYMLMVSSVPANVQLVIIMTQSWLQITIIAQYASLVAGPVQVQLLVIAKPVQT